GRPFEGGELHRSQASRDLFDATARRIDDAGGDTLEPIHLFCELMEQPTEVIAELFSSAIGQSGTDVRATPILDAFATDLTRQAEQQELEQITGRNAERQAILEVLARPDGGSIFLITDSDSAAQAVVHAVAHGVVARKQGRRMRIVDVTAKVPYGAGGSDTIEQLRMGLNEAGENPGVITVLPTIQAPPQPDNDPWADLVAMVMDRGAPQCICRFTCTSWESWVHLDPAWKKRGRAIWVQEQRPTEVPWEL
ncbi:MAG: hypothetical protein GY906_31595, partial [bacterium]|nr:hypothetical protein [bacterium]